MGLLNIFKEKEFKLKDKRFEKLNMQEAKMPQWISLQNHNEINLVMIYLFGIKWRTLPFKSANEILNLRFGDYFVTSEQPFNFETWNSLLYLAQNLNEAQRKFLKQHDFLPHRYVSMKEECELLKKETKQINITLQELQNSNEMHQYQIQEKKLQEKQSRIDELELKIQTWEQENPDGGNPANAKEYISDELELKEWLMNNEFAAQQKSQMFQIMCHQLIAALNQLRKGQAFPHEDFGHQEEFHRRKSYYTQRQPQNQNEKNSFNTYSPSRVVQKSFNTFTGKPLVVNKVAKSTKLKTVAPIQQQQEQKRSDSVDVKQELKFSDILNQQNQKNNLKSETQKTENINSDYQNIRKRVAEQHAKQQPSHNESNTTPTLTIVLVALFFIASLLGLMYFVL